MKQRTVLNKRELEDHFAIGALIEDKDGRILSFKHQKWGFWTFPVGKGEDGETAEEATIREMREECGIYIKKLEKIYEIPVTYSRDGNRVCATCVLFRVKDFTGIVENLEPHIHEGFDYRTLKELSARDRLSDMLMLYLDKLKIPHKARIAGKIS